MSGGRPLAVSYCTKEAKKYRKEFAEYVEREVVAQGWALTPNKEQHFYVDATFYFPRTDMDSSNCYKVLLDAITDTQKIWLDDNVALERTQGVFYDSQNPRVEIVISPVDYVGIFESKEELCAFEEKCTTCTRFSRNCSIIKKAKSGYIQDTIADGSCLKYRKKEIKDYGNTSKKRNNKIASE